MRVQEIKLEGGTTLPSVDPTACGVQPPLEASPLAHVAKPAGPICTPILPQCLAWTPPVPPRTEVAQKPAPDPPAAQAPTVTQQPNQDGSLVAVQLNVESGKVQVHLSVTASGAAAAGPAAGAPGAAAPADTIMKDATAAAPPVDTVPTTGHDHKTPTQPGDSSLANGERLRGAGRELDEHDAMPLDSARPACSPSCLAVSVVPSKRASSEGATRTATTGKRAKQSPCALRLRGAGEAAVADAPAATNPGAEGAAAEGGDGSTAQAEAAEASAAKERKARHAAEEAADAARVAKLGKAADDAAVMAAQAQWLTHAVLREPTIVLYAAEIDSSIAWAERMAALRCCPSLSHGMTCLCSALFLITLPLRGCHSAVADRLTGVEHGV